MYFEDNLAHVGAAQARVAPAPAVQGDAGLHFIAYF